ncbi:MAG: PspC domain-containing protein [Alphaproteobacteria bacterium]|nr:PspC domain-containing protein [Alphaproteobacteria bacterium]
MNKIININFQGFVIPIEEPAYEKLKEYVQALRECFKKEDGAEEIVNDIEGRIAELMNFILKDGHAFIAATDIDNIIKSIGKPEDMTDNNADSNAQNTSNPTSNNDGIKSKRLTKSVTNKFIGGVCGGIANYFAIDPIFIRILFIITIGFAWFVYLILWIVLPPSTSAEFDNKSKKLYRNIDEKIIGGVCSGLASYFKTENWIFRILFVIPFISMVFNNWSWPFFNFLHLGFSPAPVFLYGLLWLIVPAAKTTSQKLHLKGEKIQLDNIKHSVQEKMQDIKQSINTDAISQDIKEFSGKTKNVFKEIIQVVLKIIGYACLVILWIVFFGVLSGFTALTYFVLKFEDFFISSVFQEVLLNLTLAFFIWVPIIGLGVFLIRRLLKATKYKAALTWTFVSLHIVGWICLFLFISLFANEFKTQTRFKEPLVLEKPNSYKMMFSITDSNLNSPDIFINDYNDHNNYEFGFMQDNDDPGFKFKDFSMHFTHGAYLPLVNIQVYKTKSSNFSLSLSKQSQGKTRSIAQQYAQSISYSITQQDSLIYLDKGILIDKNNVFRGQRITLYLGVPEGKSIYFSKKLKPVIDNIIEIKSNSNEDNFEEQDDTENFKDGFNDGWEDDNNYYDHKGIRLGKWYKMTTDGIEREDNFKHTPNDTNNVKTNVSVSQHLEFNYKKASPEINCKDASYLKKDVPKTSKLKRYIDIFNSLDRFKY